MGLYGRVTLDQKFIDEHSGDFSALYQSFVVDMNAFNNCAHSPTDIFLDYKFSIEKGVRVIRPEFGKTPSMTYTAPKGSFFSINPSLDADEVQIGDLQFKVMHKSN